MSGADAFPACKEPCAACPWRTDVEPGEFSAERFAALAVTAYDLSDKVFGCHKSRDEHMVACAGFLERGAVHNLSVRLAYIGGRLDQRDRSGGHSLHPDYRAMAVANGVEADDPALRPCR